MKNYTLLCFLILSFVSTNLLCAAPNPDPSFSMANRFISNNEIPTSSPPGIFWTDEITIGCEGVTWGSFYELEIIKIDGNLDIESIYIVPILDLQHVVNNIYYCSVSLLNDELELRFNILKEDFNPGAISRYRLRYRYSEDINELSDENWNYTDIFEIEIEGPVLNGDYIICYSGETHNISNYPGSVYNVSWIASSNLALPYGIASNLRRYSLDIQAFK